MLRPWRVGLLVDTNSAAAVRAAIRDMSSVWGGYHMPIFDKNHSVEQLKHLGRLYNVDSLYAEEANNELREFLRSAGWTWGFGGPWGPFRDDAGYRKGPVLSRSLRPSVSNPLMVTWDDDDELDLFYAAQFGLPNIHASKASDSQVVTSPPVTIANLLDDLPANAGPVGIIENTRAMVTVSARQALQSLSGIYVVRVDHPQDVVEFWNRRSYGVPIVAVPSRGSKELVRYLMQTYKQEANDRTEGGSHTKRMLRVWGFVDAEPTIASTIDAEAERLGRTISHQDRDNDLGIAFPGLQTQYVRSVHIDFPTTARWINISLPELPLRYEGLPLGLGIVAADVEIHSVTGLDPRLTASLPPFRRHSALLDTHRDDTDHARVTSEGVVFGIQVDRNHVQLPFVYNLDAIRLIFDDAELAVDQSNEGKFQTRAAEILGGAFTGLLNQPGIRAAILEASRKTGGVTLQQLRHTVKRNLGEWPDPLYGRNLDPTEYAKRQVNYLLHSGLFVPMMDIHCTHCRVDSQASPSDLDSVLKCEFCGENFRLALSLSLSKSAWRYRLASHLGAEKVYAILPVIATASLLQQLRVAEAPPLNHVLGMKLKFQNMEEIEVDIAAYVPDQTWAAVVGEIKSGNRIDSNDIENLETIQARLHQKQVPCILLFSTLKEEFSPIELDLLRKHVERSRPITTVFGVVVPALPLVLTERDLSLPWSHDAHPWRWGDPDPSIPGLFQTAIESCRKNLGLADYHFSADRQSMTFEWKASIETDEQIPGNGREAN